jgi:hypothetical protein
MRTCSKHPDLFDGESLETEIHSRDPQGDVEHLFGHVTSVKRNLLGPIKEAVDVWELGDEEL